MKNEDCNTTRIEYLSMCINDAQEIIRFIETKTAIVITILSAFIIILFSQIGCLLEYSNIFPLIFDIFFWSLMICYLISILITYKIISPISNPSTHINMKDSRHPNLKFYLSNNNYLKSIIYPFIDSKKYKLDEKFSDYLKTIHESTENDIIDSLAFELFKVSYIRNLKHDRFKKLTFFLFLTSILFISTYVMYTYQTSFIFKLPK